MAKVVWDIKYAKQSSSARYKAYFVARGFTQVYRVDYEKKFVTIIYYDALYIFLAITTKNNQKIYQVDIVTTFLAKKLDKVIYLYNPHFF